MLCCVHMHTFVLSSSHLNLLVCVSWVLSLLLICSVFCMQSFASSSCVMNMCLARIMKCNPAYTSIIIFITFVLWVSIMTGYGVDSPGIESWWEVSFSVAVQTSPGAHPISCAMGTWYFPGVQQSRYGFDHLPPSSAEVKERVELYIHHHHHHTPPQSRPLWPVLGWTVPLPLPLCCFRCFIYCYFFNRLRNLCLCISWLSFLYISCNIFVVFCFITVSCIL
jgi:hypothetical protein